MGLGSIAKRDMKTVWKPNESDLSRTSTHRRATKTFPTLKGERDYLIELELEGPAGRGEDGYDSDGDKEVSSLCLAPRDLHQMAVWSKTIIKTRQ